MNGQSNFPNGNPSKETNIPIEVPESTRISEPQTDTGSDTAPEDSSSALEKKIVNAVVEVLDEISPLLNDLSNRLKKLEDGKATPSDIMKWEERFEERSNQIFTELDKFVNNPKSALFNEFGNRLSDVEYRLASFDENVVKPFKGLVIRLTEIEQQTTGINEKYAQLNTSVAVLTRDVQFLRTQLLNSPGITKQQLESITTTLATHSDDLSDISEELKNSVSNHNSLEGRLDNYIRYFKGVELGLQGRIDEVQHKVDTVCDDIKMKGDRLEDLDGRFTDLSDEFNELAKAYQKSVHDLGGFVNKTSSTLTNISNRVSVVGERVNDIDLNERSLRDELEKVKQQLETDSGDDVKQIRNELGSFEIRLSKIEKTLATGVNTARQIEELKSQLNTIKDGLTKTQTNTISLDNDLREVRKSVKSLQEKQLNLTSTVSTLGQRKNLGFFIGLLIGLIAGGCVVGMGLKFFH